MTCYHPVRGFRTPTGVVFSELKRHDILGRIDLPCGQCIGCRMRRASDWALRVMHEAKEYEENCFVTLTYGPDTVPADGSLDHKDFQDFMKRVRWHSKRKVRYYMCGEYGPNGGRPHYHACLFNIGFRGDRVPAGKSGSGAVFYSSEELSRIWGHGLATVQDLVPETASYCARYIMKKALGPASDKAYEVTDIDTGEIRRIRPEYAAMSLKPGIGARWYQRYGEYAHRFDRVIADGVERPVPRYYDKLLKRSGDIRADEVEYGRQKAGQAAYADNTDERLRVREVVHKARVRTLKRNL